jgi:hypothetical protein
MSLHGLLEDSFTEHYGLYDNICYILPAWYGIKKCIKETRHLAYRLFTEERLNGTF